MRSSRRRHAGSRPSIGLRRCRFLFGNSVGGTAGAAAELWGRLRHHLVATARHGGLHHAFSLGFQAGAIAVFIRWRVAAARRAGSCPSLRPLRRRFLAPPMAFPILTEVLEWHYHEEDDPCLSWFRRAILERSFDVRCLARDYRRSVASAWSRAVV